MDFLTLVQNTEEESGTVPSLLSTTVSQTGRHKKFVNWVKRAWSHIQALRSDWDWLRADFSGDVLAGVDLYDGSAMGISSRFRRWIANDPNGCDFTLYLTADGQSTEGYLRTLTWDEMRRIYRVGSNSEMTGKPTYVAITPTNKLCLWPIPDAAYTLRGEYVKGAQTLSADADVPELPEEYHEIILYRALMLCGEFDEATEQNPYWLRRYEELKDQLLAKRTPAVTFGGPLA